MQSSTQTMRRTTGCAAQGALSRPKYDAKKRAGACAARPASRCAIGARGRCARRPAESARCSALTAPPAWSATPPDAASALCAPKSAESASTPPRAVSAAAGAARSAGTRPACTWTCAVASAASAPATQGAARLLHPLATMRIEAGACAALAAGPRKPARARHRPARRATGAPLAGQLQCQPAAARTQAAQRRRRAAVVPGAAA